jgi:predicted O-methyltransferase YrrM
MNPILKEIQETGETTARDGTKVKLHSAVTGDEAALITELVKETKPAVSLEVGLAYGISALAILDGIDQAVFQKHICIDPVQKGWRGIGLYNLERAGFSRFVEFHEARSYEALPRIIARGERVDFAFIDGWHTFDYALVDFFLIDKLLRVGAVVVLDDGDWPAVRKLLRFIATNLDYSVIRTTGRPLSLKRRIYNGAGWLLARLHGGGRVAKLVRATFRPELLSPDEQLGLRGSCVALQKGADDTRRWDHFSDF